MNIAYTSSDTYAQYTGISLISLFEHNRTVEEIIVYIISFNISKKNLENLISIAKQFERKIIFINGEEKIVEFAKEYSLDGFHGSINSYTKIFPDLFLPPIERVLFLDADTIINGSLEALYNTDLDGKLLAAVPDVGVYFFGHEDKEIVEKNEVYFNTGVILYNMEQAVKSNLKIRLLEAKKNYIWPLKLADQSLLNLTLENGEGVRLHFKYNNYVHTVPSNLFRDGYVSDKKDAWFIETVNEIVEARKNAVIIHYVRGPRLGGRPWYRWNTSYYSSYYKKYWKRSPWKDVKRASNIKEMKRIKHILNKGTKIDTPVIGTAVVLFEIWFSKYASRKQWDDYRGSKIINMLRNIVKRFI